MYYLRQQLNFWQLAPITEYEQNQQSCSRVDITPRRMEHNEKYNKVICLGWNWCYLLSLHWPLFVIVQLRPGQFSITSFWFNGSLDRISLPLMMLHNSIKVFPKFFGLLSFSCYRLEPVSDPWELGGTGSHSLTKYGLSRYWSPLVTLDLFNFTQCYLNLSYRPRLTLQTIVSAQVTPW